MTGKERIQRILRREPVDRIGLYEHFWPDTERLGRIPCAGRALRTASGWIFRRAGR